MAAYETAVLALNPFVYWTLGDSSGPTAVDSSPNGYNGTYNGTFTYGLPGPIAHDTSTAVFDTGGATTWVSGPAGTQGTLQGLTAGTFACWAKSASAGTTTLAGWWGTNNVGFEFTNTGIRVFVYQDNAVTAQILAGPHALDGKWHFICAVINQSVSLITLYVDGVSVGTTAFPSPRTININPTTTPFSVSNSANSGSFYAAQVFACTTAITALQVFNLYTLGHPLVGGGFAAWWANGDE